MFSSLASFRNPGASILVGVVFVLVVEMIGWLLVLWREG